jgi:putative colanic acid biosynthesis glycosyltransferase
MAYLSIVTVTFNNPNDLKLTLNSIYEQLYSDIEVIVIDGGHEQINIDIISIFKTMFIEKGIHFQYQNEPDKGPYDGMNKGIDLATGTWINFLNSGDLYTDKYSLNNFFNSAERSEVDIIAGHTKYLADDGLIYQFPPLKLDTALYKMPFCHQSIFIKTELVKKYKFDLKYKIIADHAQILILYLNGYKSMNIPEVISFFKHGGISSNAINVISEIRLLLKEQKAKWYQKLRFEFFAIYIQLKKRLKKIPYLQAAYRNLMFKKSS